MTQPRFKATLWGRVIGWYDTAEQAYAAIEAAKAATPKQSYSEWYDNRRK